MDQRDSRIPVVIVAGWSGPAGRVARSLGGAGTVVVEHDLGDAAQGVVRRTMTSGPGMRTAATLEVTGGCVSCTVRADLLPLLRTLAVRRGVERIVVALDRVLEPQPVCWAIENLVVTGMIGRPDGPAARDVRVAAVVTCLDAHSWLADATGDEVLADLPDCDSSFGDDRTVAQIVVGQVEYADALVVRGSAPDEFEAAKLMAVFARLAPSAPVAWVNDAAVLDTVALLDVVPARVHRGGFADPHGPLLGGEPPLDAEGGVVLVEFTADRPFHPTRLHEALDVLLDGVVTARGRMWLATQPDDALWLESAGGGLRVGNAGRWLAAMTQAELATQPTERRAMAALRWTDRFGDRDTSLVVLVHSADPSEIERGLRWALVTDVELQCESEWRTWPDPFGAWHADPCGDSGSPYVGSEREEQA